MRGPDFFIFSCPRAGSTLLAALLSEDPDVFVLNDSYIYERYAISYSGRPSLSSSVKWLKRRGLEHELEKRFPHLHRTLRAFLSKMRRTPTSYLPNLSHLPPGTTDVPRHLARQYLSSLQSHLARLEKYSVQLTLDDQNAYDGGDTVSLRHLLDMAYDQLLPSQELTQALALGEKTPLHLHYSPWIRELYPEAQFITLIRHPVYNIGSMRRHSTAGGGTSELINRYLSCHDERYEFLYSREDVLVVRFEDLISAPEQTLQAVFQHLGVDVSSIGLEFAYYTREHYVGNRIDPDRAAGSKETLSRKEQLVIRSRCRSVLERFYPDAQ